MLTRLDHRAISDRPSSREGDWMSKKDGNRLEKILNDQYKIKVASIYSKVTEDDVFKSRKYEFSTLYKCPVCTPCKFL